MAAATLLGLPHEILELIVAHYFAQLEIVVRYPWGRINTHKLQDGAVILLVCKFLHKLGQPVFFEKATFGHHRPHLLKDPSDKLSLVLAPANLPMDKFKHVCFDVAYARSLLDVKQLWPWSNLKYLILADPGPEEWISDCTSTQGDRHVGSERLTKAVFDRYRVMRQLQEIATIRGFAFMTCLGVGSWEGIRLCIINETYTARGRPQLYHERQLGQGAQTQSEVELIMKLDLSLTLGSVRGVLEENVCNVTRWLRESLGSYYSE